MDEDEKKYNSDRTPKSQTKSNYMKFNEEEDDEIVSETEKKDTYDINITSESNSDYTMYVSKNGNKINLSGKDLSSETAKILLNNLIKKYPNITELDINNCNLEIFPKILLNFKKLISFDLRNNNFIDFESLAEDLSSYNNLTDLKVDLTDQNQVLLILSQIPKLIFLNGKSTKEAVTIVDLEEKDIQDISLQNEVEIFNDIINKLNEREEQLNIKRNELEKNKDKDKVGNISNESSISIFSTDFQNKLYEEAENIKNNLNNNLPNYMYANYVIKSQLILKKMLSNKFLSFLDKEDKHIGKIIFESIFKTGERLVQLLNALYPKIEEKTDSLRNQLEEAWKIADEINNFEIKYKQAKKDKDIMAANLDLFKLKFKRLEEENNVMTKKLMDFNKDIEKKNNEDNLVNNTNNKENISFNKTPEAKKQENNIASKEIDKDSKIYFNNKNINNSYYSLSNNLNNSNYIQNNNSSLRKNSDEKIPFFKPKHKILSLKIVKDLISEIYSSKAIFDKKCIENGKPRETMEQHMYTFLNQKYGLKNLIIEWASSIIYAIKMYSNEDAEVYLFGKILRNELDEESRFILIKLQENISQLLEFYLKSKNPLKSQMEIQKSLNEKKNGILTEEEWKGIIFYLYNEEEGDILEKKIISYIQKNKLKNNESIPLNTISEIMQTSSSGMNTNIFQSGKSARFYDNNTNINNSTTYIETHGPKKMTRREMFDLYQFSEDLHIFYKHFINVIGEYQIKLREKYLKNFVKLFRKHDTDLDGVLNENEFINLIKDIPFCQNNLDEFIFKFLSVIDPFDNKVFIFNDCVSLFSLEIIQENIINNDNEGNNDIINNINYEIKDKDKEELENGNKENVSENNNNYTNNLSVGNNKEEHRVNIIRNQISLMDKICLSKA